MNITYRPSDYLTEVPEPPSWMNDLKAKLFTHHCTFFVEQGAMLKHGLDALNILCDLESRMIEVKLNNEPVDIETYQVHKDYCEWFCIDNNVDKRIDELNLNAGD